MRTFVTASIMVACVMSAALAQPDADLFVATDGNDDWSGTLNAPNADRLRAHYENLPKKLESENVNPHIPWLYNFKLDFRFK